MTQGRQDLNPGEVSDRILNAPRIKRYGTGRATAGVKPKPAPALVKGEAGVALASGRGPDDAVLTVEPQRFKLLTPKPAKFLPHTTSIWQDGVWCWACVACSDGGEGTRGEVTAAASAHRATA